MKVSEMWSGFLAALRENDIPIEADAVQPAPPAQEQPTVETKEQDPAIVAQIEEQQKANAALQARIAELETSARTARLAALAQGWHGDQAGHLAILEALGEGSPAFAAYVTQQQAFAELARQSKLFAAAGSDQIGAVSAWAQIEAKARKVAADQGITVEQATVQVMDADPDLYKQYMAESK